MEVILEVERADGVRSWHRLPSLPFTVGRGLANDLILDDPYVDARHATIARDAAGALIVEDLGSVNGLRAGDRRVGEPLAVRPGMEVRVGRTTLRFRDPHAPVAPALVDDGAAPPSIPAIEPVVVADRPRGGPAAARGLLPPALARWIATTPGRLTLAAVATGAVALYGWFGSSARSSGNDAFGTALGFAMLAALWAVAWSLAGRAIVRRFDFVGHLGVTALAALAALATAMIVDWLQFLLPDATAVAILSSVLGFALLASVIAGHLALATAIPRPRRWRNAGLAVGTLFAIGMLASVTKDEEFSDVPTFSSTLKPVPVAWLPTASVDEFGGVMEKLRKDADELAAEQEKAAAPAAGARDSASR